MMRIHFFRPVQSALRDFFKQCKFPLEVYFYSCHNKDAGKSERMGADMNEIIIKGLCQNNLKNISLAIPKNKIVVFTGVSGSGKSSIVFDTVAAEAARQVNETYPAFVRNRMPKYEKPQAELIEGLAPAAIVDQTALGGNIRSTVGTITELYTGLRLLYSRIGQPYAGSASCFSFNDPSGMCPVCGGLGRVTDINIDAILDRDRSLAEGAVTDSTFKVGAWYWRQYRDSGFFDMDKPLKDYSEREMNLLLYGAADGKSPPENAHVEGLYNTYKHRYLTRDMSSLSCYQADKSSRLMTQRLCPECRGRRLNREALSCWIDGYSIADMCQMELPELRRVLERVDDARVKTLLDTLVAGLTRMIDIGLPYLNLDRETPSLSGGEAQRLKLVRYLGSSLTGMLYIFDEPSTGMHPRDVYRMNKLLIELRDRGNTVLVVEHDRDVIAIADEVIDLGPLAGRQGGQIVFQGSPEALRRADTLTGRAARENLPLKPEPRKPTGFLPIRGATLHNLKGIDVDIPTGCVCVITGVAGSGKSSLISGVFAAQYADRVIRIDQSPITATGRSTPASYLGFMDAIRKLFAEENGVSEGMFSFNSTGACPHCQGKGVIVTELVYMDPVVTTCEECGGQRYNSQALSYKYRGKNILEVLSMTALEAEDFFQDKKILKGVTALREVGLAYMTLGQPLSTLSGGERQRLKLAKHLWKKGSIYILDEPTTGLHPSDCRKLMELFERFAQRGSSVLIIEHNTDVMKRADYIIDIGPDGGRDGGELVFAGTPAEMIAQGRTITAKCLRAAAEGRALTQEERREITKSSYEENTKEDDDMENLRLRPIGRIVNKDGEAYLALDIKYAPALEGLEGFSHIQVYWWFDGCDTPEDRAVLVNDKPYTKGPERMGAFATRSPQRPNPIAVTTAQLIWMDKDKALVGLSYIDARNGTPVLDIKPYTPSLDRVEEPVTPDWCAHWPEALEKSGDFDWEAEFNF